MKGRHTYWLEKLIQREIAKKILDLETQSKFMEVSMAKPITDDGACDISAASSEGNAVADLELIHRIRLTIIWRKGPPIL